MKNKKKNNAGSLALIPGKFKARMWPWLFVLLAALILAATYIQIAIEFNDPARNVCAYCTDYISYVYHYYQPVDNMLLVAGALVLVAVLCAILFIRKRKLTVTPSEIVYQKGRKTIEIPLSSIESINVKGKALFVAVPFKKFKFTKLKNAKAVLDAIVSQRNLLSTLEAQSNASMPDLSAMAAPLFANPTLAGKLAYFKKLLDTGLITKAEYNKYVDLSRKAEA